MRRLRGLARRLLPALPSLVELGGLAAVALGLGLVYLPAGVIAAGIGLVVLAQGLEKQA